MMDPIYEIELEDCPVCRGTGAMQDEQGWCVSVCCMDCGAETAHASYHTPEERWHSSGTWARSSTPAWVTECKCIQKEHPHRVLFFAYFKTVYCTDKAGYCTL